MNRAVNEFLGADAAQLLVFPETTHALLDSLRWNASAVTPGYNLDRNKLSGYYARFFLIAWGLRRVPLVRIYYIN